MGGMTAVTNDDTGVPIAVAAEQLGVHPRTLRRYINDGRIASVRYTSQVVRIHQEDIDKFLQRYVRVDTGTGTCYVPRRQVPVTAVPADPELRFMSYKGGERRAISATGVPFRVLRDGQRWLVEKQDPSGWVGVGKRDTRTEAEDLARKIAKG